MRIGTTMSSGLAAAFAAATLVAAVPARADVIDEVSKKLIKLEAEAGDLERGLSAPKPRGEGDDTAQRRLIEAEVAYGRGLWAEASIMLYDIVEKHPRSRVYREAVFYLADSLHQKHDFLSARDYFKMVVHEFGEGDKHYQEALQRLIELSLRLHDDTDVKDWLARLDRIPQGQRSDERRMADRERGAPQ